MYEQGYITKEEQEEALADDVYARIQNVDTALKENETPYSYYTDELISQVTEALKEQLGYTDTQASIFCSAADCRFTPRRIRRFRRSSMRKSTILPTTTRLAIRLNTAFP